MRTLATRMARICRGLGKVDLAAQRLSAANQGSKRLMSGFDDRGSVLREEERSRETVYMKQREAELLEKLHKQGEKLEEIKRALAEVKENHQHLTNWIHESKSDKQEHKG
ncbi:hypothetical protein KP509_07G003400 [Ceratopteris richardii]|uniref:Mitochondrial ATPase inhibitor n=1 Tax=Ceratopteris richardii TaxID=49495 RepID=A0A8T2UDN4_CERRI|nr:hypothetical protein KP509_07G003400 [Ceratopteris richardii]